MAAAGTGFRGGDRHPRGQVAVGGGRPPDVVDLGLHHPDIRRWLHAALGAADAGFVSAVRPALRAVPGVAAAHRLAAGIRTDRAVPGAAALVSVGHQLLHLRLRDAADALHARSEEHTSELQSLMRISYAVFCLKKKKNT